MRKLYDELIQQKPKDMAKTLEDICFKFPNPETHLPTIVPASHFEKEFGQEIEKTVSQAVSLKFLSIMYDQLNVFRTENPDLFYKALICLDNGLNPKKIRMPEQIALNYTYDYMEEFQAQCKKEKQPFHFFNQNISEQYKKGLTDQNIQARKMDLSNFLESEEAREFNNVQNIAEKQFQNFDNDTNSIEEDMDDIEHDDYY